MSRKYKYTKYFTVNGQRCCARANDLVELGRKIEQKTREVEESAGIIREDITLNEWAEECISTFKTGQQEITAKKYLCRIRYCILRHLGHMKVADIRLVHCQRVLNLQTGMSKTQINEVYNGLRFLFKYAVINKLVGEDPTAGLVKPSGYRNHRRALTAKEREAFIAVGKTDRRFYIFLLMIFCGCRPAEAEKAMGKDITIRQGYPMLHIRGTKTANADRYVPIPYELYELIEATPHGEYIACTSTGHSVNENNRRRVWHTYCREINIYMGCKMYRNALIPPYPLAPDLVPYCLRHEYCTELARQGIDLRIAQKLMGHSDIKLTANIYTNLEQNDIIPAAEILCKSNKKSEKEFAKK